MIALLTTPVFAKQKKEMLLINTSASGYMTVTYGFCGDRCGIKHYSVDIYSKKESTADKKHYVSITIPDDPEYYGVTIHHVVEKEVIDGKPSESVIAETNESSYSCSIKYPRKDFYDPLQVIELNDANGSPFVICKGALT